MADDIDYQDLEAKYAVDDHFSLERFVLVDGLPQVPESKAEKLEKVLVKLFSKVAPLASSGSESAEEQQQAFQMPIDSETKTSKGFAFVEFKNDQGAQEVVKAFNKKKLDAKHTLLVDKMATVAKYIDNPASGEYVEPKLPDFKPLPHLRSWLTDPLGRDQAAMHADDGISVLWMRKDGNPQPAMKADPRFTDQYVRWSPQGTYLLSVHQQGVALHAGPNFEIVARLPQRDVRMVDFSPDERFLVTGAATPIRAGSGPFKEQDEGNSIVVWSIETQSVLRSFPLPQQQVTAGAPPPWPAFRWSANSQFFARIAQPDTLSIYDSSTCSLVGKKSMSVPGIADFAFAPASVGNNDQQFLALWTPEQQNQTARVCIVNAATKEIVHNRSLFNVFRVTFFWQNEAKFLCSKIERLTKNKKAMTSSLEIYRISEKSMPIEVLDFKETVLNFAWEPKGDRFAIVSYFEAAPAPPSATGGPAPGGPPAGPAGPVVMSGPAAAAAAAAPVARMNPMRNVLSFYALERQKKLQGTWKEANRFADRPGSVLQWSPRGRFLAVGIPGSRFAVDFWDVDHEQAIAPAANSATPAAAELPINVCFLKQGEHIGAESSQWDPSGRYLLTVPGAPTGPSVGGRAYVMWDMIGTELRRQTVEGLRALMWRPRPASILPKEDRKRVAKEYKKLSTEFDQQDLMLQSEESEEIRRKRSEIISKWSAFRERVRPFLEERDIIPEEDRFAVVDGKIYAKQITVVEETEEEV